MIRLYVTNYLARGMTVPSATAGGDRYAERTFFLLILEVWARFRLLRIALFHRTFMIKYQIIQLISIVMLENTSIGNQTFQAEL